MVIHSTTESFNNDVAKSDLAIVDFFADWCGPCKVIAPILEKFDANTDEGINILKINVDEQPELAGEYGIRNIPTLLFVRNGEVLTKHVGTLSENELANKVKNLI